MYITKVSYGASMAISSVYSQCIFSMSTQFVYKPEALSAFILSGDTFIVSLRTGELVRHTPQSVPAFYRWLLLHNIREIKKHAPKPLTQDL